MKPKLPELFGRLPKAPLDVVAMPAFVEKDQAAAYYDRARRMEAGRVAWT